MFFGKPKPTVTRADKDWNEEAFLSFERQYGRELLMNVRTIEPTTEFFSVKLQWFSRECRTVVAIDM